MPCPRPQFRLSTLLWITLAVACLFGGMAVQRRIDRRDLTTDEFEGLMRDYWERHNPIIADYNEAIESVTNRPARPQWTIKLGPPTNDGDLKFIVPNQVRTAIDHKGSDK
jgi:hypothetical protein